MDIMLPVCTSVAAVPASARRHKSLASLSWLCWAGLGWAGLGWAGLGWVGAVSGLAVSSPGPAKMAAVSWRSAEQRAALLSVLSGHYIVTCCTHPHTLSSVLLTTTRYSRVSISSTAGDTAQVSVFCHQSHGGTDTTRHKQRSSSSEGHQWSDNKTAV